MSNQALEKLLNNDDLISTVNAADALKAIILLTHPEDVDSFKKALGDHQKFWQTLDANFDAQKMDGAGPSLISLYQLATEKFMQFHFKLAIITTDKEITAFINKDNAALRTELLPSLLNNTQQSQRSVSQEEILSDATLDLVRARVYARHVLYFLEQKINDSRLIEDILSKGPQDLISSLTQLGFKKELLAQIKPEKVWPFLQSKLVLQQLKLTPYPALDLDIISLLEQKTADDFIKNAIAVIQKNLRPGDVSEARGILGLAYLKKYIAESNFNAEDLKKIATQNDAKQLTQLIETHFNAKKIGKDKTFIAEAVQGDSSKSLNQKAAIQLIQLAIQKGQDLEALKALSVAKNIYEVRQALKSSTLNLDKNEYKAIVAMLDETAVAPISTAAQVLLNVQTAMPRNDSDLFNAQDHLVKLEKIIGANQDIYRVYLDQFDDGLNEEAKLAVWEHLSATPSSADLRRQALLNYLKIALVKENKAHAKMLSEASNIQGIHLVVEKLVDKSAVQLLPKDFKDNFNLQLRAYAYIALEHENSKNANFAAVKMSIETEPADYIKSIPIVEQQQFIADQIKNLLGKYPADQKSSLLIDLAKAKSAKEFSAALALIVKIPAAYSLSEQSQQEIQALAAGRALQFNFEKMTGSSLSKRPELKKLLTQLPTEKQVELAHNPEIAQSLLREKDTRLLQEILNDRQIATDDLAQENANRALLGKIYNAEIAKILGNLDGLQLTVDKVERLNTLIQTPEFNQIANNPQPIVDDIWTIVHENLELAPFHEAFGLNKHGKKVKNQGILDAVATQHQYNTDLIQKNQQTSIPAAEKLLLAHLLPLPKTGQVTTAQLTSVENNLDTTADQAKFLLAANSSIIKNKLSQPLEDVFSNEFYKAYKSLKQRENLANASKDQLEAQFKTQQKDVNEGFNELNKLKRSKDKLAQLQLGKMTGLPWNRVFGPFAKENALQLEPAFTDLATSVTAVLKQTQHQLKEVQQYLNEMPVSLTRDAEKDGVILAHRNFLRAKEEKLKEDLLLFQKIDNLLHGEKHHDPFLSMGILAQLQQAKKGDKTVLFKSYNYQIKKIPVADLPAYLKSQHVTSPSVADHTKMIVNSASNPYFSEIDALAPGEARIYIREVDRPLKGGSKETLVSRFAEKREALDMNPTVNKAGQTVCPPALSLVLIDAPKDSSGKVVTEELVNTLMGMASRGVSELTEAPTPENPIILEGSDTNELRLLYMSTWLHLQHSSFSGKITPDCIRVNSLAYNPSVDFQKARLGGIDFKPGSAYEQCFKDSESVKKLMNDFKQFTNKKEIAVQELKTISTKAIEVSRSLKEDLAATKIEEKNKNLPAPPQLGPSRR